MNVVLVDVIGFLVLLVPLLWVAQQKGLSGGWAVLAACGWWVGGLLGTIAADATGFSVAGGGAIGRLAGVSLGYAALWWRPDSLPERVVDGIREVCVYRAPGPFDPAAIAAFLTGEDLRTTVEPWAVWVHADDAGKARRLLPGFVAPRLVHRGASVTDAHIVGDWLSRNGLEVQVRGSDRGGAVGGIPVPDSYPEVWVRGADQARAEALMAQLDAPSEGEAWTCPRCEEPNPPVFASCWSCRLSVD